MRFLLHLFGEESAFGRFLNRLYIVIVSNLLFVLFSIPVFTIGASWTALCFTLMKLQRGDRHFKVTSTFWKGFKENFPKATLCFCILAALALVQYLEMTWCRQFTGIPGLFRYALAGLMLLEIIIAMYLFPVIAAFNGKITELLRDSFYFAFSQPLYMLVCLMIHLLPLVLSYLLLQYLPLWAFLWFLFGFSTVAYLSTHLMLRQFVPFLPSVDICGDIIPESLEGDANIVTGDKDSDDEPDEKTLREMMKYGL